MSGTVHLHPAIQQMLNSRVLTGAWAYPQPSETLRAQQEALLTMGFAAIFEGVGQDRGRQFLRLTDDGLRNVTGDHADYARSKIGTQLGRADG